MEVFEHRDLAVGRLLRLADEADAFGEHRPMVEGMDVVRRILAAETVPNAGSGGMRGQMIAAPVRIVSARRVPLAAGRSGPARMRPSANARLKCLFTRGRYPPTGD